MEDPSSASDDDQVLATEDGEIQSEKKQPSTTNFALKATHEAKLKELLHKINSFEIKLCSDATKEFIKLLKADSGADLLHLYVLSTSNFSELFSALKLHEGKPGSHYVIKLISVVFSHPAGLFLPADKGRMGVSVVLDKFARLFIENKLDFVHKELTCKDKKRKNAALLVMASIVRRGSGLASEVAKKFDFKLKGFSKLSEYDIRKSSKQKKHSANDEKRKCITRKAFVSFAMSFLEVGKPGLLRWVLQQKEVYSGVLRVLVEDDDETVMHVLTVLRDKVLTEESLIPPPLRSVLFGSAVLEQLVDISSGRKHCESTSELAYHVLFMVCTDPCNGLMPDLKRHPNPLRGNTKRLLQLMKKLKAPEVDYHRELLLAIVRSRPSLGSAYLDVFPYNLEDYTSSSWFSFVSLAAKIVSLVTVGIHSDFLDLQSENLPSSDGMGVQNIIKIIHSRALSRSVINKGLLHSDFLVKNGTLRLLLETLRLFDSFFRALNLSCDMKQMMPKWTTLQPEIWNEIQALLPDPQVFLTLLAPLSSHVRPNVSCLKRTADEESFLVSCKRTKKLKRNIMDEDTDIIIGGISSAPDDALAGDGGNVVDSCIPHGLDCEMDFMNIISELWGSDHCCMSITTLRDAEIFFYSKLLDAMKLYALIMPTTLEGSFDFFMNLLKNPSELPSYLLSSLLSLLVEYIRWSPGSGIAIRTPQMMYKHLQPFLSLLLFSSNIEIKDHAFKLAQAAMSSTGAFDRNLHEITAWFLFLPGYSTVKSSVEIHGEVLQSLSTAVISFLCDAISTVGNNLFRYWHAVRNHAYHLNEFTDILPEFSPLMICVLQKCIRLLSSESGTFSLPEKTMVSVYVCNTLKYLLQTQVDARLLATLIRSVLSDGLQEHCSVDFLCEWQPLKNLLLLAQNILDQNTCCLFLIDCKDWPVDICFMRALDEIRKIVESGDDGGEINGIMEAFYSVVICTTSDTVLKNFPTIMAISQNIRVPFSFLSSIIYLDQSFLAGFSKLWPKVFFPGLEKVVCNSQVTENDSFAQEIMLNFDFDASEATAAVAFALFLRQAPFHVLFPILISSDGPYLSESSTIKDLLIAKLSECTSDFIVSYSRLLLFWFNQIQLFYRIKPSVKLKQWAEICYILVKHMLDHLLVLKPDSRGPLSADLIQDVVKTISCHPAVQKSLTDPLGCDDNSVNGDFAEEQFRGDLEAFLKFSWQRVHPMDHHILDMLTTAFDTFMFPSCRHHYVLTIEDGATKQQENTFKILIKRLYLEFKAKLDLCIRTDDLLPLIQPFYALHALSQFSSPFELFELAHSIIDQVELNGLTVLNACIRSALSMVFCIAADAFKILSMYLRQPVRTKALFYKFWEMEEENMDVKLIEELYVKLCKFATDFGLDFAYSCLLEAVSVVYNQKYNTTELLDPLSLGISRFIMCTPIEIVSHCINGTSKTKAELLSRLVEMSPLHLSLSGYLFSRILNKNIHYKETRVYGTSEMSVSDEGFLLLLPAVHSYLNSVFMKLEKQYHKEFTEILSFYSKILLSGFRNWKTFVSENVFQENYDEFLPSSVEEVVTMMNASLLGKAMHMLRCNFALSGEMEMEERLKMFSCIFTSSDVDDQLLDCHIDEIELYSFNQFLNLINRVGSKIVFCQMMLFSTSDQTWSLQKEADESKAMKMVSGKEGQSRLQFIQIIVRTWQCIVKKFPSVSDSYGKQKGSSCLQLYRYLELFILKTIHQLTSEMRVGLIQLQTIPFLEQLMRSSLLYRFEDPTSLSILHTILAFLSEGKFSSVPFLQLLLAHSQFASTINSVRGSQSSQTGALFRPMPSILRSLVFHQPKRKNDPQPINSHLKQLEIVKLLRKLIQLKPDHIGNYAGEDMVINLKELYILLLSSYGATLSEIDLEIFGLMHMIESIDNSVSEDLASMDYLWGNAVLRIKKERASDGGTSSSMMTDTGILEENRRSQFRDILPVNPMMCMTTVIHFPYDRILSTESEDPNNLRAQVAHFPGVEKSRIYDPIFILKFSNHNLSMGYIEPLEFACLGLLAVAFISMSSPDVEIRKLGEACLGKFKDALEWCQKKKDLMRLHLLLTYMQNGIKEELQRIPSVIALFAAESSFILLDPSNDLFTALSNHLMCSSRVDMKCIPLFHMLFQSNSVNFRAERLWMLHLACAGLNLDDDAQIFISNSILKTLLSFYATPLADNESKELILQVVKKSVKLDRMTHHLVECCGLFPWLSSILSSSGAMLDGNENHFSSRQLVLTIEVVFDTISSGDIMESAWFENSFEQCMELASHLCKILVGGSKLIKENAALIKRVLQIIISILKISHRREMCRPHFTLSFEGLFGIYQAFNVFGASRSGLNAQSGLEAILNSTPPADIFHMNQEKLSGLLMWAVSTAANSDCENIHHRESHGSLKVLSGERPSEESLISRLLRWLVAAVILGRLSWKRNNVNTKSSERSSPQTLHSFLEYVGKGCVERKSYEFDCEEVLAVTILYLQQLLGLNRTVPSSVVSALSILLCDLSKNSDFLRDCGTDIVSIWSKVRCPIEANPEWRWSFNKPWTDPKLEINALQQLDEYHACQTLVVVISNFLGKKPLDLQILSRQNLVSSEIFEWERRIVQTNN